MKTKLKQISSLFLCLTSCVLILNSCDTTDPPPGNGNKETITISVEDTSPTEVWLNLTTQNLKLPADLLLLRNGDTSNVFSLTQTDTLIYDDSLQPSTTYTYQVSSIKNQVSSNEVTFTTMDTTSHNFTWQTYTFGGQGGSSALYDVAIINENDIWAVGEIYTADDKYNAVHWDGSEWELLTVNYGGHFWSIRSVFAFSENEVWFSAYVIYDGERFIDLPIPEEITGWGINKTWGVSSSDFYVVGNGGNIARFNGSSWQKIESGTDVDLKDIWGTPDGKTIWISGYEDFKPTVLLKISNSMIETVFSSRDYLFVFDSKHISGGIGGVWTNNHNFVYLTTWYSLYRKSVITDSSEAEALRTGSIVICFGLRSRGTDINNIFTIGCQNTIHHYNGVSFRTYQEPTDENVTYYGLDVRDNLSALCGQKYENGISDKGIITLIKK